MQNKQNKVVFFIWEILNFTIILENFTSSYASIIYLFICGAFMFLSHFLKLVPGYAKIGKLSNRFGNLVPTVKVFCWDARKTCRSCSALLFSEMLPLHLASRFTFSLRTRKIFGNTLQSRQTWTVFFKFFITVLNLEGASCELHVC